jgi:outer membrane protein OmpU
MEVTWTTGGGNGHAVGNPLGQENEIGLAGSTELDNGVTVSYSQSITNDNARNDSELSFGNVLGGTLAMTSKGEPIGGIADETPNAFEEANAQVGSITAVGGTDGTFGVRYTMDDVAGTGFKFDYMYYPKHGTGDATGDQAMSGAVAGTQANKDAHNVAITGSVPGVEGLSVGVGYATLNYELPTAQTQERDEGTAYVKYAIGPLTVGAQIGGVSDKGLGTITYKNEYYGISYAVSDNLSLSYNMIESTKGSHEAAYAAGLEQDFDSISLSYTAGGMTIGIADADCSNCSYTNNRTQDETTISLSVAF